MSGAYSLFEAAPVVNYGYYDVPICNKYSNKDNRDSEKTINEYNFNSKINNTLNDNKQQYLVQQYPTIPSPSLYIESNNPMAGYYNKLQKKSELKEHFSGTSAVDDYSYLYANDNNDGLFIASNTYSNYYETHDTKPDYLNAQNIPNISNLYLNRPESGAEENKMMQNRQFDPNLRNDVQKMNVRKDYLINDNNSNRETKPILNKRIIEKKLKKNLLKNKIEIKVPKKIVPGQNKKPKNRNIETLCSIIFVLTFIILILSLLIFFRHFK